MILCMLVKGHQYKYIVHIVTSLDTLITEINSTAQYRSVVMHVSHARYIPSTCYRMAGNFRGVLIFVIFVISVVDLAVAKFSHP